MRVCLVAALFAVGCGSTHADVDAAASDDAAADDVGVDVTPQTCQANTDCSQDTFCAKPCKTIIDHPPTCQPRPTCDDAGTQRACACDGHVYDSACLAMANGVLPAPFASDCPAPDGTFACEYIYCDAGTYCQMVHGLTSQPDTCLALPPACVGSTDCACFGDAGCGTCQYVPDAGFRWSCVID